MQDISSGTKRNIQKEAQFYQTSKKLAKYVGSYIIWKNNMRVLEPSAGRGALLEIFDDKDVSIDLVEKDEENRKYLYKYFVDLQDNVRLLPFTDFLALNGIEYKYDLIVANPPFTNRQDIKHVRHMMDLLVPSGQLITFMAVGHLTSNDKLSTDFRAKLDNEFDGGYVDINVKDWDNNGAKARTVLYCLTKK